MAWFWRLQELVVMNRFKRSLGWFVTLLQFSGYAFFAWLQRMRTSRGTSRPKVPWWCYVILSVLQALMQGLTNVSMHYLNYPAKTLFKSSRLMVTMIFGFLVMGKRYSRRDYLVVLFMVVGLGTFLQADAATSPTFELTGVILIVLALAADAAILNLQEHCMQVYNACHEEMVYYSYMGAAGVVFVLAVVSGELSKGLEFVRMTGSFSTLILFLMFCGTGYLGVNCATALIKRFGALVSAITTTARKAMTLILSYVVFNNTGTTMHAIGAALFMLGLLIKVGGCVCGFRAVRDALISISSHLISSRLVCVFCFLLYFAITNRHSVHMTRVHPATNKSYRKCIQRNTPPNPTRSFSRLGRTSMLAYCNHT